LKDKKRKGSRTMSRYYHYETFGNKALGHVNIFELRDVCGVELFDFEG
jgi:hypothetical protein